MYLINKFKKISKLFFTKNLFLIVFLGPDGSGKSSLIRKLMLEYKYIGFNYYSHIYPSLDNKASKNSKYPYSKPPYSKLKSNFKVFYMLLKNVFNFLLILLKRKNGKTIIWCDRYLYDIFADPLRYRLSKIFLKPEYFKLLTIKPNLIIILNPPINNILERSSEISKKELIIQNKSYDNLKIYFSDALLIKNNYSINDLADICKSQINKSLND